ncbi:hypothetical protein CVT26_010814 [Gymnopilus dilepis]|uniref:Exoribonuclease phosphorolytic domain-containing protein n=1 Tax=Gymnopilus dilepis TaxID=231916 RepID=A0A409VIH5_9AGAR|nr:hypothetical protein CVT26_010814 [Gymnopilus dilepis]
MAQNVFDRRRTNGPEESVSFVYEEDLSRLPRRQERQRKDRMAADIRPIFLQPGLIGQAAGSAYIEIERTKIACAIAAPALIQGLQDAEDRSVAIAVQQALLSSVRLETFPKATVDIFITVIETDSMEGCVAAGTIAASTALAHAGIEVLGLVMSCSAAAIGAEIWLDPNDEECRLSNGTLVLSCMPALTTLTSVWQTGRISPAQVLSVRLGLLQTSLADQIYRARRHARTDVMTSTPSSPKHCSIVLRVVNFEFNNLPERRSSTSSMSINARDEYVVLKNAVTYPSSPSHSNHSDDSLRALELSDGPAESSHGRRGRSYSVSGFDFQHDLLPLSASVTDPGTLHAEGTEKSISLINGIALIVGLQIGSGIFSSPGVVVANTHSVGASLLVWLASGLLAWTGASSFAELGSAIPQNGGAQAYLSYAYGPLISYLFAWTAIIALKPGGNAVISLIFAEYLNRMIWHTTRVEVSPDDIPQWAIKLTATGAVLIVTALCVGAQKLGTRVAVIFTTVKIMVTVLGIVQLVRGKASTSLREPLFEGSSTSPSSYSLAFYSGLWAFDGWDQANFVGGEMTRPEKNIPRAIHSSMILVTLLFLLANVSYFVVLDKDIVGLSNTVAMDFGRALFGPIGGSLFAFTVAFSCFGALNGSFFTSSRLVYAAGRERYLPAVFGKLHSSRRTPLNAALLQAGITITFIMIGSGFRSLINFSVVASWAFYFLTVLGLVILRIKEPMLERPYKTWITTPLIFCAVALFLLCMPIIAAPKEAAAVLGK